MISNKDRFEDYELRMTQIKDEKTCLNKFCLENFKSSFIRPKQKYHMYKSLPEPTDKGNYEEWLFTTQQIEKTLRYLLSAPLQRFWCHVVYDKFLSEFITSFFQNIERPYDYFKNKSDNQNNYFNEFIKNVNDEQIKERKNILSNLFFCLMVRMSTRKENKELSIPEEIFGDILYQNYVFDLPRLLDICSIYAPCNQELVKKMISNIFHLQPKYLEDVVVLAQTLPQLFNSVYVKCGMSVGSSKPAKLKHNISNISEMSLSTFEDLLLYVFDTSFCLRNFFEIYSPAAKVFDVDSILSKIANFYENISSFFLIQLEERSISDSKYEEIFSQCRINWLHVCHHILLESTLKRLFDSIEVEEVVESYISNITSVIEHKRFLADYFLMFPVETDKRLIEQSGYVMDSIRMDYVTNAIEAALQHYAGSRGVADGSEGFTVASEWRNGLVEGTSNSQVSNGRMGNTNDGDVSGEELMCMITSIQDLLPNMGSSFLKRCLQEYKHNHEEVVNVLLEDKLPPHLATLDRTENLTQGELEGRKLVEEVTEGELLLAQRKNVFDNDEFDVFHNLENVDKTKIIYGKKDKLVGIEDKTELKEFKPIFDIYGNEFTEGSYYDNMVGGKGCYNAGNHNPLDYEDEYDDAFDELEVPAADNDSADELTTRKYEVRPLKTRMMVGHGVNENDEDDDGPQGNKSYVNFIEDPAVRRERAAQQRARQFNNRPPPSHPARDVKGGAKGEGQSDGVLRDRHFKEKNKALRGNHNRKNLAGRKNRFF